MAEIKIKGNIRCCLLGKVRSRIEPDSLNKRKFTAGKAKVVMKINMMIQTEGRAG